MNPVDITIPHMHLQNLLDTSNLSKEIVNQYLNINDPEIIDYKKNTPPAVKVIFSKLDATDPFTNTANRHKIDGGLKPSYKITPVQELNLWDLEPLNKVDTLTCGRFKDRDFSPVVAEDPIKLDLGVSREHSLICFYNSQVFYIDYGTSIKHALSKKLHQDIDKEKHSGSRNGSWFYENFEIKNSITNECVGWQQEYIIGIGSFFYNMLIGNKDVRVFHQFSFNYEYL